MINFVHEYDTPELKELSRSVPKFASRFQSKQLAPEFRRADFAAMAELGLTGSSVSEAAGGSAIGAPGIAAIIFELARAELGPAIYLSVHLMVSRLIQQWGRPETCAALVNELANGSKLAAFCLTEASAGSDAAALKTKAVRDGSSYVLNGEKIYITSGGVADVYLTFARSSSEGAKGISAFVVHRDTPGISFGAAEHKMGCESAPICSVTFSDCRVPESARLGDEGQGYKIALSGLAGGRVSIAAAACGLASRSLELARDHALSRKQFGQAIAEFQGLQFMLADMVIGLNAAIVLTRHAAERLAADARTTTEPSIAKCFATDQAMEITTNGVQILGGAGYLRDYLVERLMRDAKMLQIVEGTNQIQRMLIARTLLTA